jgi:hypothetical protein
MSTSSANTVWEAISAGPFSSASSAATALIQKEVIKSALNPLTGTYLLQLLLLLLTPLLLLVTRAGIVHISAAAAVTPDPGETSYCVFDNHRLLLPHDCLSRLLLLQLLSSCFCYAAATGNDTVFDIEECLLLPRSHRSTSSRRDVCRNSQVVAITGTPLASFLLLRPWRMLERK